MTSCVSFEPNQEYALAQTALSTAKKFEADKLSPKIYSRAMYFYRKGISLYKQEDYDEARNFFEEAVNFAEKAEFKARVRNLRETE